MTSSDLKLIRRLHARTPDPDVVTAFFSKGKEGYDLLLEQIRGGDLTKWQMCSAMELLVRMRGHGDQDVLFSVLLEITADDRAEVRAKATRLVISLTVIAENRKANGDDIKNANKAYVAPFIRSALTRGFANRGFEASAREFLGE